MVPFCPVMFSLQNLGKFHSHKWKKVAYLGLQEWKLSCTKRKLGIIINNVDLIILSSHTLGATNHVPIPYMIFANMSEGETNHVYLCTLSYVQIAADDSGHTYPEKPASNLCTSQRWAT